MSLYFQVVSRCNEGARKMEQTEQVLSIENKLMFTKLKVQYSLLHHPAGTVFPKYVGVCWLDAVLYTAAYNVAVVYLKSGSGICYYRSQAMF